MDANIARGKNTLIGIIAALLGLSLISILVNIIISGTSGLGFSIIGFALSCLFFFFLFKGQNWAKWLLIVLWLLGGVLGLIGTPVVFILNFFLGVISLASAIIDIVAAVLLIASKDIKAFLEYQKGA